MRGGVSSWNQLAGAPIETAPEGAGSWLEHTAYILPARGTETLKGPECVMTEGAFRAGPWVPVTLIDITFTGVALEARWASALDLGICG